MTIQMNIRIDEELKNDVEPIFNTLGITIADAFRIFLKRVKLENGIPFSMKLDNIPNKETQQAMFEDKRAEVNSINELWEQYENN